MHFHIDPYQLQDEYLGDAPLAGYTIFHDDPTDKIHHGDLIDRYFDFSSASSPSLSSLGDNFSSLSSPALSPFQYPEELDAESERDESANEQLCLAPSSLEDSVVHHDAPPPVLEQPTPEPEPVFKFKRSLSEEVEIPPLAFERVSPISKRKRSRSPSFSRGDDEYVESEVDNIKEDDEDDEYVPEKKRRNPRKRPRFQPFSRSGSSSLSSSSSSSSLSSFFNAASATTRQSSLASSSSRSLPTRKQWAKTTRKARETRKPASKRNSHHEDAVEILKQLVEGETFNFNCPICATTFPSKRKPDFKRHIETHLPPDLLPTVYCVGALVNEATLYGIPADAKPYVYEDEWRVGGCRQAFSRGDALRRHLNRQGGVCEGYETAF